MRHISAITFGELRRGVEKMRHQGDNPQAEKLAEELERWLNRVSENYADAILPFDQEIAQVWGKLRVPQNENPLDKQIAATALMNDLIVVTRNVTRFESTGVRLLNPFE